MIFTNKNNLGIMFIISMLVMNLFFWVSMALTPKYEAEMRVLFIQKQIGSIDVYTAAKSAERISISFNKIIHSSRFLDMILQNDQINSSYFNSKKESRVSMEKWEKTVKIDNVRETGILEISVWHPDQDQAQLISNQILRIMEEDGSQFHGGGSNVQIMRLDEPEVSIKPASPNVPLVSALGLMIGFLISVLFVYLKSGSVFKFIQKSKQYNKDEENHEKQQKEESTASSWKDQSHNEEAPFELPAPQLQFSPKETNYKPKNQSGGNLNDLLGNL